MQRFQCPIHNGALKNISLIKLENVLNSDNVLMFSCQRNAQITFAEKPQMKIISCQNYNS